VKFRSYNTSLPRQALGFFPLHRFKKWAAGRLPSAFFDVVGGLVPREPRDISWAER
jgi:hypothetical protein